MSSRLPVSTPKHVGGGGRTHGGSHHRVQLLFCKMFGYTVYRLATGRDDVIWNQTERKDVRGMKPR